MPIKNATVAVVLCAGSGVRAGSTTNKVFIPIRGRPMAVRSVQTLAGSSAVDEVFVVAAPDETDMCADVFARAGVPISGVVEGGSTRHRSEANAVSSLTDRIVSDEVGVVMIHDGARPFFSGSKLPELIAAARRSGGAMYALPLKEDLLVTVDDDVKGFRSRDRLWRALTPQVFRAGVLLDAFRAAERTGWEGTDTASTVERIGGHVEIVRGESVNLKVTWPEDFAVAEWIARLEDDGPP